LIGVIFGLAIAWLLIYLANSFNISLIFVFPWDGVLVAILFSLLSGFLFGFRPAKKAAKLDPVEAIRTE